MGANNTTQMTRMEKALSVLGGMDDVDSAMGKTRLPEAMVRRIHEAFTESSPKGYIERDTFHIFHEKFFGFSKIGLFAFFDHLYRVYDRDGTGTLSFMDLLQIFDILYCGDSEEKLLMTFRVCDAAGNGTVEEDELQAIIQVMMEMSEMSVTDKERLSGTIASSIFKRLDTSGDGHLSKDEFIQGCLNEPLVYDIFEAAFDVGDINEECAVKLRHDKEEVASSSPGTPLEEPEEFEITDRWFQGISKAEAEDQLLSPGNQPGTFLIRRSSEDGTPHELSLSVLVEVGGFGRLAKHYKIRKDGSKFYIQPSVVLDELSDLINYYTANPGLCCRLSAPCTRSRSGSRNSSTPSRTFTEINQDSLHMGRQLAKDLLGEIWIGSWRGKEVAVRRCKQGILHRDEFIAAMTVRETLRHENLVSLFGICPTEPALIVTELTELDSVWDLLKQNAKRPESLPFANRMLIAGEIAEGMSYLEGKNYVHGSLMTRTVFITADNVVKIGEMGMRAALAPSYYAKWNPSYTKWSAPEVTFHEAFSVKSDVWAFGILLVELTTWGEEPYLGLTSEVLKYQLRHGTRHTQPEECPDALYHVMLQCWAESPDDRPAFRRLGKTIASLRENVSQVKTLRL